MRPSVGGVLLIVLAALVSGTLLAQETDYAFMPPGGRTLFAQMIGGESGEARAELSARKMSAEDWREWATSRGADLDEQALATVAGYAALNFPLADEAKTAFAETGDPAALPPDGKDLAIAQCQFCHSLFSGYLMHRRDEVGWRGTFKAPFHAEIPMSEVERDTFAHYSALNMPLRFEDVPPELRF